MDSQLTLIGAPNVTLETVLLDQLRDAVRALGGVIGPVKWLSPGRVADMAFGGLALEQADAAARQIIGDAAIDVVANPVDGRRKLLLVADMDATMVVGETLDELADFAGIKEKISAITARAMNGEIGFEDALRERIGLLSALTEDSLEECWKRVEFMPGAKPLVATMKANGAGAVLVSGGFTFFTGRVRQALGFDVDFANRFIFKDGRLAGVEDPILGREAKLATLTAQSALRQLPLAATLAVGDGANDLDMIRAAGMGVAYHAKPVVASQARVRIDHNDLTGLLYAQGYADSDFVLT